MTDKPKRDPKISTMLPQGTAADSYIDKPDDKGVEGAQWKPDGKYKIKIVYEDETPLAGLNDIIRKSARAKWPDVDFENFNFPFTSHEDDARREGFRGKTVVAAKTQFKLEGDKLVDSKRVPLPDGVKVFGGDIVKAIVSLYLYEKTEKVKEGKKIVDVVTRGCSLQLDAVQLIQKRAMGGGTGDVSFGEEEGFDGVGSKFAKGSATEGGTGDDWDFLKNQQN